MGFDQYHEPPDGFSRDGSLSLGIGSLKGALR
jgi:hypothetical protein